MDVEELREYLKHNPPQTSGDYHRIALATGYTDEAIRYHCRQLGITISKNQGKEVSEMAHKEIIDYDKLSQSLLNAVKKDRPEIHLPKQKALRNGKLTEQAVLVLSDIHYGKVNEFYDTNTNKRTVTYSPEIFTAELNRLLDGVSTINELLLGGYNLETLNILAVGDLVDNELIYKGQKKFVEEGVIAQVLDLASYLKKMTIELLALFPKIRWVIVGGNHARITSGIEADWDYNNFDYLVGKILQLSFEGQDRIEVVVPESWYYVHKIYKWRYLMHHGNNIYSWMSLPYYGIVRQSKARALEVPYDIEIIGHFHPSQILQIPTSSHSLTIVNGSWINKDEFGWKKFASLSSAKQFYFGVSAKRPISWAFPLDLSKEVSNE